MHPFFDHRLGHRDVMRLGIGTWVSLCAHGLGAVLAVVAIVLFDVRGCLPSTNVSAMTDDGELADRPAYEPPAEEWVIELEPPPPPVVLPELEPELAGAEQAGAPELPPEPAMRSEITGPTDLSPGELGANAKAAEIAEVLAELNTGQMAVLGALSGPDGATDVLRSGVATEGVLSGTDVPEGILDGGRGGARLGAGGLATAGRGAAGPAAAGRGAMADIGDLEAQTGSKTAVAAPPLVISLSGIRAKGGLEASEVHRHAAGATRTAVKTCARKARARGVDLSGRLVLDLDIDESGHAHTVVVPDRPSHPGTTWTDAGLIRCSRRALEIGRFPKAATSTSARLALSVR